MSKYFIRIDTNCRDEIDEYLCHHNIPTSRITYDFNKTIVYCVDVDKEEALRMRLSIQMVGMVDFEKSIDII